MHSVLQCMNKCSTVSMKLFRIIIDVQGGELLHICNRLYDGEHNEGSVYSEQNGEAVIDFLKQWDGAEYTDDDLTEEKPRWVKNGTDYVYNHDGYTMIYNCTLGGVYMLYREATEQEMEDYLTNKRILNSYGKISNRIVSWL